MWVSSFLLVSWFGGASRAEPLGIWELAASHEVPVVAEMAFEAGGLVVMSDQRTAVLGVRPESGLVVWKRRLAGASGLWALNAGDPSRDVVLVANGTESLVAYRADVGQRLWELPLDCAAGGCQTRVVHAAAEVVLLEQGAEAKLTRVEASTGKAMWSAPGGTARAVVVTPSFVALEEAQSPFDVVFLETLSGRELGRWTKERKAPASAMFEHRGRLISVELRPEDGGLARVVLVRPDGGVDNERFIGRPAAFSTEPVLAAMTAKGVAIWTPEPQKNRSFLTTMRLEAPFTARTESVATASAPLIAQGTLSFFPGGVTLSFVRFSEQLESAVMEGVSGERPLAFADGKKVIFVERRAKASLLLQLAQRRAHE
jgi:uncharacterized protein GlcG (DUF336 family)